jgi:hypothetical protein
MSLSGIPIDTLPAHYDWAIFFRDLPENWKNALAEVVIINRTGQIEDRCHVYIREPVKGKYDDTPRISYPADQSTVQRSFPCGGWIDTGDPTSAVIQQGGVSAGTTTAVNPVDPLLDWQYNCQVKPGIASGSNIVLTITNTNTGTPSSRTLKVGS